MKRRVFGNEHEYTLTETPRSDHALLAKRLLSLLQYAVPFDEVLRQKGYVKPFDDLKPLDLYTGRWENTDMLQNQARAYYDSSVAEYATQECDNVFDLIACEKAGEKLFLGALVKLRMALKDIEPTVSMRLFKNNRAYVAPNDKHEILRKAGSLVGELAHYGNIFSTVGTHDNYMIERTVPDIRLQRLFIPHLIALSLFTGGGCVEYDTQNLQFEFSRSQRFPWIHKALYGSTQSHRSFLVFREQENFSPIEYQRMQVISGDANLCEGALLIKYATSAALLEMLEDNVFYAQVLEHEVEEKFEWALSVSFLTKVARAACSISLDEPLPTSGYAWTLRSLATYFAELRQRYNESVGFSEDRRAGLKLEQELLKQLAMASASDESLILAPYSDHAFMRKVVEHDMEKYDYSYLSPPEHLISFPATGGHTIAMSVSHRFRYLEAMCHEIDPNSRFEKAQRMGLIHRVVTPEAIASMETGAPATTRANRRKIIADELRVKNKLAACRWTGVTSIDDPHGEIRLLDPFISEPTPKVREF